MVKCKKLVESGYFPKELPPPFNSRKLGRILHLLELNSLELLVKRWQQEDRELNKAESKCCSFSIPRTRNIRRMISIPNPLYQIILCHQFEKNWDEIAAFLSNSYISISLPVLPIKNEKSNRSFDTRSNYENTEQQIAICSSKYRVMLKTDIARFYNTIYTHSIPWALHEKEYAKLNRSDSNLCGNVIDKWVRSTKEGQTLGIPVGPDTSLLISEIICTAVEKEFERILGKKIIGVRFFDDLTLFFNEKAEALVALTKLLESLNKFELEINPVKTSIEEIPYAPIPEWKSTIRHYVFRSNKNPEIEKILQKNDLLDYFSKTFDYYNKFSDHNVLLYALKAIQRVNIYRENWELMESFILKIIIFEGSCIPTATDIFLEYYVEAYPLNKDVIKDTIIEIITYNSRYSNDYEISWALWLLYVIDIKITDDITDKFQNTSNPVIQLMILDLREKGLINVDVESLNWKQYLDKKHLYDEHWLIAYEAYVKGWLPSSDGNFIDDDPFFKILKDNGVEFYENKIVVDGDYIDQGWDLRFY